LGHLLSIFLGILGGFSKKTGVFGGNDSEFIVEAMMPDFFHHIPIFDDSVFNRVGKFQNSSLDLGFRSDVAIFIFNSHHDVLGFGFSDDGGEHGSGGVFTGFSGFAHS
jgi:hypothetical protein